MVFPDCSTVATYKNRQKYLWWFDEFSASEFEQHNDTGFEYWIIFWIVFIPVPVAILNPLPSNFIGPINLVLIFVVFHVLLIFFGKAFFFDVSLSVDVNFLIQIKIIVKLLQDDN